MIGLFFSSVLTLLNIKILILMVLGVVMGLIFGAIPGLTATMAVALMLPITFNMDTVTGTATLMSLYVGGISGGLISAILLKIPGTPSSIATCFDGHPMAAKGEAGRALATGIFASFIGGMIGLLVLVFLAPPIARFAITFGPFEYFSIGIFALTVIASLSSGSLAKGIISGFLGIFFASFGMAPIDAVSRFDFGIDDLKSGFSLLPVLLGVFALSDTINELISRAYKVKLDKNSKNIKGFKFGLDFWRDMGRNTINFIRSSLIGTFIGILPGIGGSTASILSYNEAKRSSKYPEKFGTGISDGIVASESANNAMVGGALTTLVTLGLPGDSTTAILLGGLMIHGLQPGPLLIRDNPNVIYAIMAALFISNILFFFIESFGIKWFIKLLDVPKYILYPSIIVMCIVGSYANDSRMFDVYSMIFFGFIGFLLNRYGYSLACFVIGFILGPIIETNFRRGLMSSGGSLLPFVTRPISLIFLIIAVLSIVFTIRRDLKKKKEELANT